MKRIFAILFIICITLSFVACGGKTDSPTSTPDENDTIAESHNESNAVEDDSKKADYYAIISGKKYSAGMPLQELINDGYTFESDDLTSNLGNINFGDHATIPAKKNGKTAFNVYVVNYDGGMKEVQDGVIAGFQCFDYYLTDGITFSTINDITFGTSVDDIISFFGVCDNVSHGDDIIMSYIYEYGEYSSFEFMFEDDIVTGIWIKWLD